MRLIRWRKSWKLLSGNAKILLLLLLASGCITSGRGYVTLTSKDLLYTIPENTIFTTIKDGKPVEVMAEYELIALTKGKYLELIKKRSG